MSCFYCTKDQRLLELMIPLAELQWSDVYLFRDQKHPGRCVVALKGHKDEIFQLTPEERDGFFREVSAVAKAIYQYAKADKINYAIYGDIVSHFHVHLVPKVSGGLEWGGPFTDTGSKVFLEPKQYQQIATALGNHLRAAAADGQLLIEKIYE